MWWKSSVSGINPNKMKQFLLSLLLLPLFSLAQTKGFTISGTVSGVTDGEVKITSTQDQNQVIASGTIKGGVIDVKGTIQEPGLYWLVLGNEQPRYIFLENTPITINGQKKDIKNVKIEGSKSHKDFQQFESTFSPLFAQLNVYSADLPRISSEQEKQVLMKKYDSVVKKINREVDAFVSARSQSYVSPFLIYVTAQLNDNPSVLEDHFNKLSVPVQNSNIGKNLKEYITFSKVGSVGSEAIDFTQADTAGRDVKLSSFRGKYVLVDFWASWCRPCRIENPNVVSAYQKFKDKNFTVLGISLDEKKEAWINAIKKDNLTWTQLSDLQSWNNAVARLYRVQSIPQNLLIDPNGKIVAKDLRGEDLQRKLCELLGCN